MLRSVLRNKCKIQNSKIKMENGSLKFKIFLALTFIVFGFMAFSSSVLAEHSDEFINYVSNKV